jgi:archaellum component FlaC
MKINGTNEEVMKATWLFVIGCSLLGGATFAAEPQDVDGTRTALEKWVETRKVISQEQRDWALGKEMLNERIDVVQQEIDSLQTKISEAKEGISAADEKRTDLVEENERLKAVSASLGDTIIALEDGLKDLLKRLPDPLRDRVKPLSQRLPADSHDTKQSLSERFQNIVGILNEVDKFNREITMTSEVRTLPDGSSAEVTAVYAGIGQAWYAGNDGKTAGTGSSSPEGWIWTSDDRIGPQVLSVISILKNEQVASFVQMPVAIQ